MKILIANRGEIAVRVMRTCREMGLRTVAIHSDCDRGAPHVAFADEAWPLGGDRPADTYLHIDKILEIGRRAGADAVHPGYGFLAENAAFARGCADAGFVFIGPDAPVVERMGSKTAARAAAIAVGVPVVPGCDGPLDDAAAARTAAAGVGYPLLVKAVAGGGGKGMRVVAGDAALEAAFDAARSEALTSFGDAAVYLERHLASPRHIEVQLLGDARGTVVAFVERECSIQRRHQKVVEESPSPVVSPSLRERLASAAVMLARAVGYTSAGTIEFLVTDGGDFYFLEMNTRLQVEHPVTELVTGVDLVAWQIRIARGESLDLDPERALVPWGHAIECRIYAEDPDAGFLPSPGRIAGLRLPSGPGVRVDAGVSPGFTVPLFYDPMIAKLLVWGGGRPEAVARLARALDESEVRGLRTTIPFFRWLVREPAFLTGSVHTSWLDRVLASRDGRSFAAIDADAEEVAVTAAALQVLLGAGPVDAGRVNAGMNAWKQAARLDARRVDLRS